MDERDIIEAAPDSEHPHLGFRDKFELNEQSAYNRSVIENSPRCGCFHCESIFSGSDVKQWLSESDGEDTALCPYCGVDAVIIGSDTFPLSTALLAGLHLLWFKEER